MMHPCRWFFAACILCLSHASLAESPSLEEIHHTWSSLKTALSHLLFPKPSPTIETLLRQQGGPLLSEATIQKTIASLTCAQAQAISHTQILTIIDYSLPSNQKRLWIFDLKENKLLFNTYVSHGITSGTTTTTFLSNKNNSKASSVGVYRTEQTYYGRDGLSLRLQGLDKGFNDNASQRYIVMHGGWYVEEDFIKKYGRAGRSWGCPALPSPLTKPILTAIQDKSFLVIYYPSDTWLSKSKFLNCKAAPPSPPIEAVATDVPDNTPRDSILFVDLNHNATLEESEPIVVMQAARYEQVFQVKAPLERMLRRQINNTEYIALTTQEFKSQLIDAHASPSHQGASLNDLCFVIPIIKMQRGYYVTNMHLVPLGEIKGITPETSTSNGARYSLRLAQKPAVPLTSTNQFIRWLGL